MPRRNVRARRVQAAALGLAAAALLLLVAEGVTSLWTGRSLLRRTIDPSARMLDAWTDQQRAQLANLTQGPFDLDVDPEVGHRTKAGEERRWVGVPARTDAFGMRVRPGGWPGPDRPHWVVLGDSVAFGYGVADDATYAARIEAHLATNWTGAGPPPAVSTVGAPGWNLQSSARFLRNHLDRYAPSLVILMPVDNDLENRFVPSVGGGRSVGIDPVAGMSRIFVTTEETFAMRVAMAARAPLDRVAAVARDGGWGAVEHALVAGLAPESRRRYAAAVAAVVELRAALARRDAPLFVLNPWGQPFARELDRRLLAAAPDLPRGFLFDRWQVGDALDGDSHPNAACVDAGAIRTVHLLARAGLLPAGADAAALQLPAAYAARVAEPFDAAAAAAWAGSRRAMLDKYCGPRVSLVDATGFQQIYAGVEPDGTVGAQARVALRGGGGERALVLRIRAPVAAPPLLRLRIGCAFADDPARPDTAPLWLDAALPGDADEVVVLRAPLPAGLVTSGWIDVHLRTSDHAVEVVEGRSRLAAFRLVEVGLEGGPR